LANAKRKHAGKVAREAEMAKRMLEKRERRLDKLATHPEMEEAITSKRQRKVEHRLELSAKKVR
jgi:hypothetical protein